MDAQRTTIKSIDKAVERKSQIWPIGKRLRLPDGSLVIVTAIRQPEEFSDGLTFGYPINDGWVFTAEVRPATAEEDKQSARQTKLIALRQEFDSLLLEADDYRNQPAQTARRNEISAQITELEG